MRRWQRLWQPRDGWQLKGQHITYAKVDQYMYMYVYFFLLFSTTLNEGNSPILIMELGSTFKICSR